MLRRSVPAATLPRKVARNSTVAFAKMAVGQHWKSLKNGVCSKVSAVLGGAAARTPSILCCLERVAARQVEAPRGKRPRLAILQLFPRKASQSLHRTCTNFATVSKNVEEPERWKSGKPSNHYSSLHVAKRHTETMQMGLGIGYHISSDPRCGGGAGHGILPQRRPPGVVGRDVSGQ